MIKGIGIDIIEMDRIHRVLKNERFMKRILTNHEEAVFHSLTSEHRKKEFLAGRFAAKEAIAKATGTGIGKLSFQDIHILPNDDGAPTAHVSGWEHVNIHISISHCKEYAVAQAVIEERQA